jgi:hypothetical protein
VVDVAETSCIVELTAKSSRVDNFLALMRPFGVLEAARSGEYIAVESREWNSVDKQVLWFCLEHPFPDMARKTMSRRSKKRSTLACCHQDRVPRRAASCYLLLKGFWNLYIPPAHAMLCFTKLPCSSTYCSRPLNFSWHGQSWICLLLVCLTSFDQSGGTTHDQAGITGL